jgi:hypothetical protein
VNDIVLDSPVAVLRGYGIKQFTVYLFKLFA